MNFFRILAISVCLPFGAPSFAAAPKPKKAPPKKIAPSLSVKDLALREAKACDTNRNGKIDGSEMSQVRAAQAKSPKSFLYLFDDNSNKYLDDSELSKIEFAPGKPGGAKHPPLHHAHPKKKK